MGGKTLCQLQHRQIPIVLIWWFLCDLAVDHLLRSDLVDAEVALIEMETITGIAKIPSIICVYNHSFFVQDKAYKL